MITVYADTETPPIARGAIAQTPVCGQWAVDDGPEQLALWRDIDPRAWLEGVLVGANIAYDTACLMAADPELTPLIFRAYDEGRIVDIQLDAKLLDIAAGEYAYRKARGWNLQELARRAGVRIDKDTDDETGDGSWRLRFASLAGIPVDSWPAGARRYALAEIPATRTVHRHLQAARGRWLEQGLDPLGYHSKHAAASAFALHLMSCQGVLADPAAVESVGRRVESYLDLARRRLQRAGLIRPAGTKDTFAAARAMVDACAKTEREVLFTDGAAKKEVAAKAKLAKLTRELESATPRGRAGAEKRLREHKAKWHRGVYLGGVKLDHDVAILSGSRVLDLYCEYTTSDTIRSRVESLRQCTVLPCQARFDPLKETARTSSSQPSPPLVGQQMQNFPQSSGMSPAERKREREGEFFVGLRECFRPRDGHVFIVADYSMAELHTLSQVCLRLFGKSEMARLLNAGVDLHVHFACATLGIPYEAYDPETMGKHRRRAKPANFGYPGGMGPDKFIIYSRGYGVTFTREEAVLLKRQWLDTFPEMRGYLRWISDQMGDRGHFTHTHPVTGYVRGDCSYTDGANHSFQHLCAYGAKIGLYEVTKACFTPGSPLWDCRPINFIHDEIVAEAPEEKAHEAALEMARIMEESFNQFVPDVPTKAEPYVARRWSKKAKPVWQDGRLIPWEPPV